MANAAEVGVFGGSGFYSLLEGVREVKVDTPYGPPSDAVMLATVAGRKVAFIPRHGRHHTIPPHMVNYRANVWAMRSLGVQAVISPCAAGSLQKHVEPGSFVVCDQFVDRTSGRRDTFYDGPIVTHISPAETYDPVLRKLAIETIKDHGIVCHEMGMAVVNISLITDYDSGVHAGAEAVNATDVLAVFQSNSEKIKKVVLDLIGRLPKDLSTIGSRGSLQFSRGDGHAATVEDIRLFEVLD